MIKSKYFLEVTFLAFLTLHAEEKVWPDGAHPMLFIESSCVCMSSFMPIAPFYFSGKCIIFDPFFL